ncbi:MAG: tetratricopeptide repeat protein, partial [Alphaproteobacteria bacterium]|nr:tetratricopeptide repeat protein [Alphaproteobacteria bacterium]
IPAPNPALKDKPLQSLLLSTQSRYLKDGTREYSIEAATLIQTTQGLSALGNVIIPWQPQISELVVHKVRILRDGKEIDLLKGGQPFIVLRRENNLESAMLDGVLTAVMQPEGLGVGDVLDFSWTVRIKPQGVPFRPENLTALVHGYSIRHVRYRELWQEGLPIRWAATDAIGKPKVTKTAWGTELVLDRSDAEGPELPTSAPARFGAPARLEISGYADWNEIGRLMAAFYESAARLGPDSPLKAEIDRIAALGPDPKKRTMAALRLVQDRVRYFALAIGDGGYVPEKADRTWSRKYGDCKGKTVLLLALLKDLGVEAEPVLVSSESGDLIGARLPQVAAFNHVIVRARIDGRSYWLDGTRLGDRDIDMLGSSPFFWGLPVRAAGAPLEALPMMPPARPLTDASVIYDASKGFEAPVPISGQIVFRGDLAQALRLTVSQNGTDGIKDQVASWIPGPAATDNIEKVDVRTDDDAGTATVIFSGKLRMDWPRAPGTDALRFRLQDGTIQWKADFSRPDKFKDVPFSLEFPAYLSATETIILPRGGQGFALDGHDLVRDVAGAHIERRLTLANGRAVARSTFRILQRELPAKEAAAAGAILDQVNADRAYVRSPAGYRATAEERAAVIAAQPVSAQDYVTRGYELMQADRLTEALADFDKAAGLAPNWSTPIADRAIALLYQNKTDAAAAALDRAAALSDDDFATWQGYGLLHLRQDKPGEALEALTRALALDASNEFTLTQRVQAYEQLGRFDEAAVDLDRVLKVKPNDGWATGEMARLDGRRGKEAEAIAATDRLIASQTADDAIAAYMLKASLLSRFGHADDAGQAWTKALDLTDKAIAAASANAERRRALANLRIDILSRSGQAVLAVAAASAELKRQPGNANLLNSRCWTRATHNLELDRALADCNEALRFDPQNAAITDSRAFVKLRLGRLDEAIADYSDALKRAPQLPASLYGRGIARLRKGDKAGAEQDLAAARRLAYDIDSRFREYGVAP